MNGIFIYCHNCNENFIIEVNEDMPHYFDAFHKSHKNHRVSIGASSIPKSMCVKPMIRYLRYHNPQNKLVGVEIGVLKGENSLSILRCLKMKKLYLIDPYLDYDGYDMMDFKSETIEETYQIAKKNLSEFGNRIELIRKLSEDTVNEIPDNLDFVYIDGNHKYPYVKKDIELFYPKVKNGGVIGGDDFALHAMGVPRAVMDFIDENNIKKYRNKYEDWWITKDEE